MVFHARRVVHVAVPSSTVLRVVVIWKIKPRSLCHIQIGSVKVLQSLVWWMLRWLLLHIKHRITVRMHTSVLQSVNGVFKLVMLAWHHHPVVLQVRVRSTGLGRRLPRDGWSARVLPGQQAPLLLLHQWMPCVDARLHSHRHLSSVSKPLKENAMLLLVVDFRDAWHAWCSWHSWIARKVATRYLPASPVVRKLCIRF